VFQRIHPDDRDRLDAEVQRELGEKRRYSIGYRIVLPDGTMKHLEWHWSHEPFLLVITRLSVSAGSNDSNTLADRFGAVRPPLLVRCDNAPRGVCLTLGENLLPTIYRSRS
jgi:PAS domain-containing protein